MASDLPITPAEIETVRFKVGRPGDYRVDDVDPLLDALADDVRAGRQIDQRLRKARFRLATKRDHAYSARDVDDFMDGLRGRPVQSPGDTAAPSPAQTYDPSQTYTPEHRSLWSRVTGR